MCMYVHGRVKSLQQAATTILSDFPTWGIILCAAKRSYAKVAPLDLVVICVYVIISKLFRWSINLDTFPERNVCAAHSLNENTESREFWSNWWSLWLATCELERQVNEMCKRMVFTFWYLATLLLQSGK